VIELLISNEKLKCQLESKVKKGMMGEEAEGDIIT